MTTRILVTLLLAATLSGTGRLEAQLPGLPVRSVGLPRGLSLAADVGVPNDASGLGTTVAASAGAGLGLLGVTALVARTDVTGEDAVLSGGAMASLRLIGGPLVPFFATLQGGVGRWQAAGTSIEGGEITTTSVPVGLGLGWTIASPVVSLKPWLAPRMQWTRRTEEGGFGGETESTDAAVSGGIDLGFINGITVRGMYDRVLQDGVDASVWSVGLGYSLRIGR